MSQIQGVQSAFRGAIAPIRVAMTLGVASVGVVSMGLFEAIAPHVSVAQQAGRVDVAINRQQEESFASFLQRAEAVAQSTAQQSFSQNPQLNQLQIHIIGENAGLVAPLLSLEVSRSQWQSQPQVQAWSTRFGDSRVLLGFDSLQPDREAALSEGESAPPDGADQKPVPPDDGAFDDESTVTDAPRPSGSESSTIIVTPPSGTTITGSGSASDTNSELPPADASSAETEPAAATDTTRPGIPTVETDPSRLQEADDGTLLETQERTPTAPVESSQPPDSPPIDAAQPQPSSENPPESLLAPDAAPTIPQVPQIESPTIPTVPSGS